MNPAVDVDQERALAEAARAQTIARAEAAASGDAEAAVALLTARERAAVILRVTGRMRQKAAEAALGMLAGSAPVSTGPVHGGTSRGKAKRRAKAKTAKAARRRNR